MHCKLVFEKTRPPIGNLSFKPTSSSAISSEQPLRVENHSNSDLFFYRHHWLWYHDVIPKLATDWHLLYIPLSKMQGRSENEVIFKNACGLVVKFWMSNFGLGSNLGHSSFTRSVILESASSSCAIHHHLVCTAWSMVTHQHPCVLVPTSTTTTLYYRLHKLLSVSSSTTTRYALVNGHPPTYLCTSSDQCYYHLVCCYY